MDLAMPVTDGLTATEEIRKSDKGERVPIVAVATPVKELYQKAIEAGCNDFMSKPVDFESLESVLLQYFK